MSQRAKQFLKSKPKAKKKEEKLETADDYLALGVDFEEAGGKWRAGDAVKSMRFFQRAINDAYVPGLQRFPDNLDLAYNKARVQLEIATNEILVSQLQQPLLDVLQAALDSHRYALHLDPENADTLFDTAQVLRAIAEKIAEDESLDDGEALKLLEEALELQLKCLGIQEQRFTEGIEQQRLASEQMAGESHSHGHTGSEVQTEGTTSEETQWAAVIEPVTYDTLIETVLAQLGALTTLCTILAESPEFAPPGTFPAAEKYWAGLQHKVPAFLQGKPERQHEVGLARANFVSALLEAGFRSGRLDATSYKRERDEAFAVPELQLPGSTEGLLANAHSLMSFNSALADAASRELTLRWNALTESIEQLKLAANVQGISQDELATTHLLRGDASLLLHALRYIGCEPAVANAEQLLKNAEVFYRNAGKLSAHDGDAALQRSIVAQYLLGKVQNLGLSTDQLEDMIVEGFLPEEALYK